MSSDTSPSRQESISLPLTQALRNAFFCFLLQQGSSLLILMHTFHLKSQLEPSQGCSLSSTFSYEMEKHFSCSAQELSGPFVRSSSGHIVGGPGGRVGGGVGPMLLPPSGVCVGAVGTAVMGPDVMGPDVGTGEGGEGGVGAQPGVGNIHVQESPMLSMHVSKSKDCVLKQVATPFSGTFSPITGA